MVVKIATGIMILTIVSVYTLLGIEKMMRDEQIQAAWLEIKPKLLTKLSAFAIIIS